MKGLPHAIMGVSRIGLSKARTLGPELGRVRESGLGQTGSIPGKAAYLRQTPAGQRQAGSGSGGQAENCWIILDAGVANEESGCRCGW